LQTREFYNSNLADSASKIQLKDFIASMRVINSSQLVIAPWASFRLKPDLSGWAGS
jgi:hypothetical protein